MRDFAIYHGGLGLASTSRVRLQKVAKTVCFSLEKQGYTVDMSADLIAHKVHLSSNACSIELHVMPAKAAQLESDTAQAQAAFDIGSRIEIKLSECVAGDPESLLAYLMIDLVRTHNPAVVEWLDQSTLLPSDEFLSCFEMCPETRVVTPKRPILTKPARRFATVRAAARSAKTAGANMQTHFVPLTSGLDWSSAQVALAHAYRIPVNEDAQPATQSDRPSDPLRLATWAMSGVVACIALPVALSLFIINLLRGEDFRLNTQALSVTGLLVALLVNGALAEVVALLPV